MESLTISLPGTVFLFSLSILYGQSSADFWLFVQYLAPPQWAVHNECATIAVVTLSSSWREILFFAQKLLRQFKIHNFMHGNCLYNLNSLSHSISSKWPSILQNKVNTLNILKFFIKDLFFNYMNYIISESLCIQMCGCPGNHKRALDLLDLKLQAVVICLVWVLGTELWTSARAVAIVNAERSLSS